MIPAQYCSKVRQSPNRPHLWGGMEYQVTLSIVFACVMSLYGLLAIGHPFYGVLCAYVLWKILRPLGHSLAKKDPRLLQVTFADLRWKQDFYAALPIVPLRIAAGRNCR